MAFGADIRAYNSFAIRTGLSVRTCIGQYSVLSGRVLGCAIGGVSVGVLVYCWTGNCAYYSFGLCCFRGVHHRNYFIAVSYQLPKSVEKPG